jgi:hypothetical protein
MSATRSFGKASAKTEGMEINKLKIFPPVNEPDGNSEEELILRSGDTVSRSGIYEVIPALHDADADSTGSAVIAIRGEHVGPCQTCGDRVLLRRYMPHPIFRKTVTSFPKRTPAIS